MVENANITADSTNPKDLLGVKKPQYWLIPPTALTYLAKVMGFGAKKYGPYNWRTKKVRYTVYIDAALRHFHQALDGEDIDPESGMPHVAHAKACCAIILDALATGNLIDDRPPAGKTADLVKEFTEK